MRGFKGYIIDIISEIRLLYMYINVDNHLNNYVHMCILIQNINVYNKQKSGCTCKKNTSAAGSIIHGVTFTKKHSFS